MQEKHKNVDECDNNEEKKQKIKNVTSMTKVLMYAGIMMKEKQ